MIRPMPFVPFVMSFVLPCCELSNVIICTVKKHPFFYRAWVEATNLKIIHSSLPMSLGMKGDKISPMFFLVMSVVVV